MSASLEEMEPTLKDRAINLLVELEVPKDAAPTNPAAMIAAYQAVLTKDIRWALYELVIFKQNEMNK